MELKRKRETNGKYAAIFDTHGLTIVDIVDEMVADGWTFDNLVVSYANKQGGTSKKDVEPQKLRTVQERFNFDNWTFKAHRRSQILKGYVINSKRTAVITESKGGALQAFIAVGADAAASQGLNEQSSNEPNVLQQGYIPHNPNIEKDTAARAAAAALYSDDEDDVLGMSESQRQARREASRQEDYQKTIEASQKKHTGLIIWSIIEILLVVSILGGIIGLVDTISGRKKVHTDPEEALKRFSMAKTVLIIGLIGDIICLGIAIWKFGPIIMTLLG